ncbi:MAG TPA: DUF202 domain-containing protein [Kofleriaceae bacterium]|jgi:putative membrane protein|nr:DUF202 domain-containing protein [Kofleriaceae bacterium]
MEVKPSVLDDRKTHFAWLRTRLALERTLMAWLRTGTAMIGFGFTIFTFFHTLAGMKDLELPWLPAAVSQALIAAGTACTVIALIEYHRMLHYLWSHEFRDVAGMGERPGWSPISALAILLCVIGLVTFTSIAVRAW